jgi:ferredoxin
MSFVVTENCINCKNTQCVEACLVEAFHEGPNFLVINPDVCMDCASCGPACPLGAIMEGRKLPKAQRRFIGINAELSTEDKRVCVDHPGKYRSCSGITDPG